MSYFGVLHAIGSSPLFASRVFLQAFATALLMRYGGSIPWIAHASFLEAVQGAPSWLTHDVTLWALGVFAAIELLAEKNADVRNQFAEFMKYAKPAGALLVELGVLTAADRNAAEKLLQMDIGSGLVAAGCAGSVFVLAGLRQRVYDMLSEWDPDDTFRVQRIASWMEDGWVLFGALLLVIFPLVMLIVSALVVGSVYVLRKFLERRDEAKQVECTKCGSRIYPIAIVCHECQHPVEQPCAIGFFGQMKPTVAAHATEHPLRLVENNRCSVCASRLTADHLCSACGWRAFADVSELDRYVEFIDQRQGVVIPVCFALGLVPILGAVPAIVYYRLALVAPYRRHISSLDRIKSRWLVRIINFGLVAIQLFPFLGGLSIALMALIGHRVHRAAFRSRFAVKTGRRQKTNIGIAGQRGQVES